MFWIQQIPSIPNFFVVLPQDLYQPSLTVLLNQETAILDLEMLLKEINTDMAETATILVAIII